MTSRYNNYRYDIIGETDINNKRFMWLEWEKMFMLWKKKRLCGCMEVGILKDGIKRITGINTI